MSEAGRRPKIFLIAGEASGDAIGGRLLAALKRRSDIEVVGIGGPAMTAEGLESRFPMEELQVAGLAEILPHIPRLRRRILETVEAVLEAAPDLLVTIDAPGFGFRVGRRVADHLAQRTDLTIRLVHIVAPSVWAWKPGRAAKIARFLDRLLVLFPFEPPYFEAVGLDTRFIGHPAVETVLNKGSGGDFRARYGIPAEGRVLLVLPGSRRGEIQRLLPVFLETVDTLKRRIEDLRVVVVAAPGRRESIAAADWPVPLTLVEGEEKLDAFATSDAALAASGTVSLELGLAGVPQVVGYRVNPITHQIIKRMVRIRFASLVNILLEREVVPECLQYDCTATSLAGHLLPLLEGGTARQEQVNAYRALAKMLQPPEGSPSDAAAAALLEMID